MSRTLLSNGSALDIIQRTQVPGRHKESRVAGLGHGQSQHFGSSSSTPNHNSLEGAIYESANVDDNIGGRTLCSSALHVANRTKGVGAECTRALRPGLQPVPAWHSPGQLEFRDSQGSGGGGFRRKSSDWTMARLNAPDSDGSAANTSEHGN